MIFGKPLFVRHCGNWFRPETWAEHFWVWFMERFAGGRNVMLATGGTAGPPSQKNSNVRWIFSSSLTENELSRYASPRSCPSNAEVRLINVARQEMAKGAGTVIQSLPLLARRFSNVIFEVVGDGPAIPEFRRLAQELGVADHVRFAGKLGHEEVMHRLQTASLFVFPTTSSEGFPKAVLEALASGLPVVATRVSVLPQLLGNGCGVLVDEATPEAVACGVEQALSDPAQYEAMSRKAIETARQYSLEAWRDTIGGYLSAAWGPLRKKEDKRLKMEDGRAETTVLRPPSSVI
jgi:glycosyltransferase involved in cell wall biosynthesis